MALYQPNTMVKTPKPAIVTKNVYEQNKAIAPTPQIPLDNTSRNVALESLVKNQTPQPSYDNMKQTQGYSTATPTSAVDQMKSNSEAWHAAPSGSATSQGTKEWYAAENKRLGSSVGAERDDKTGVWYYNNSGASVYGTPQAPQTQDLSSMISAKYDAAQRQAIANSQYATQKGVADLNKVYTAAVPGYQTARNQSAITTAQNLDNSALRSALQGDSGGLGNRQYGVVQAAGDNRLTEINVAQKNLEAATKSQIAELEAQGRYQEANIVAQNAQDRISALTSEAQRIQDANIAAYQYANDLAMNQANLTGTYGGRDTLAAKQMTFNEGVTEAGLTGTYKGQATQEARQNAANNAMARIQLGVFTEADAIAAGIPADQAKTITARINTLAQIDVASAQRQLYNLIRTGNSSGSSSGGSTGSTAKAAKPNIVQLQKLLETSSDPQADYEAAIANGWISSIDNDALLQETVQARLDDLKNGGTGGDGQAQPKALNLSMSNAFGIERADKDIANLNGEGWIYVPSLGKISPEEVYSGVQNGTIIETRQPDGSYSYSYKAEQTNPQGRNNGEILFGKR